ncbi:MULTISPECIES: hypothetical protein [Clostridium]|uniref:Uncharacterized protein n=1 Tax=Clostridium senegalense TaxID=1465809 RepID=A0A6M0H5M0_9CLOT|nr:MULTISPECIES: hypothetical protein [Clostridium]NEU05817.1 hypothetical protein [Clostridium senegalense]
MRTLYSQKNKNKATTNDGCAGYCLFWCMGYCKGYCAGNCKGYNKA